MTNFTCLSPLTCSVTVATARADFLPPASRWPDTKARGGWPLSSCFGLWQKKVSWDLPRRLDIGRKLVFPQIRNKGLRLVRRDGGFQSGGAARALAASVVEEAETVEQAKYKLLTAIIETGRGLKATPDQRADVEEALVGVERFDAGKNVDLDKLDGTWALQYTTARDVVQILQASESPIVQVGQIFQKFECAGRTDGGIVKNAVRWSVPRLLEGQEGATLIVTATFSVVSPRSIALSFQEAQVAQVEISEELQSFLAPAVLPRTALTLQILQYFRNLNVRVPLRTPSSQRNDDGRIPVGTWYYLTYLDRDMLVGRALGNGGIFVFRRTQALKLP